MRRSLIDLLGLGQGGRFDFVHRVKTAQHEPFLVIAPVSRPRPAQDQQLDLVGRVPRGFQLVDPRADLQVWVKVVLDPAHRPWLVRQVGFGHARVRRAKDALARARIRLGQHGDRGHARKRAHWLHADARQQVRISRALARRHHPAVDCHQHRLGNIAATLQRVAARGAHHIHALLDIFQNQARQLLPLGGHFAQFAPHFKVFRIGHRGAYYTDLVLFMKGILENGCPNVRLDNHSQGSNPIFDLTKDPFAFNIPACFHRPLLSCWI